MLLRNVVLAMTHRLICLPLFPARWQADRYVNLLPICSGLRLLSWFVAANIEDCELHNFVGICPAASTPNGRPRGCAGLSELAVLSNVKSGMPDATMVARPVGQETRSISDPQQILPLAKAA